MKLQLDWDESLKNPTGRWIFFLYIEGGLIRITTDEAEDRLFEFK
jgi:hypothetical protein